MTMFFNLALAMLSACEEEHDSVCSYLCEQLFYCDNNGSVYDKWDTVEDCTIECEMDEIPKQMEECMLNCNKHEFCEAWFRCVNECR
jgi:hypothetical protein